MAAACSTSRIVSLRPGRSPRTPGQRGRQEQQQRAAAADHLRRQLRSRCRWHSRPPRPTWRVCGRTAPADPDEPEWRCGFGRLLQVVEARVGMFRELHAREAHVDLLPRSRMSLLALLVVVFLLPAQPTKAAAVAATQGIMMAAAVGVAARRRASVRLCKTDRPRLRVSRAPAPVSVAREMFEGLVEDIVEIAASLRVPSSTRASTSVSAAGTSHSLAAPALAVPLGSLPLRLGRYQRFIRQLCRQQFV